MSSEDINARANAVFEDMYDGRGKPAELDESFADEFFHVLAHFHHEPCPPGSDQSVLNLLKGSSTPLVSAVDLSKHLKFVVADIRADWDIPGTCKVFGHIQPDTPYQFELTSVLHFVRLSVYSLHSKSDRVEFLSHFPVHVPPQKGEGKWERF